LVLLNDEKREKWCAIVASTRHSEPPPKAGVKTGARACWRKRSAFMKFAPSHGSLVYLFLSLANILFLSLANIFSKHGRLKGEIISGCCLSNFNQLVITFSNIWIKIWRFRKDGLKFGITAKFSHFAAKKGTVFRYKKGLSLYNTIKGIKWINGRYIDKVQRNTKILEVSP
jgi:hypothetical protein